MTRYLTLSEIMELHQQIITQTGGANGLRDRPALESAVAQPAVTFSGQDLYPTVIDKAAALGFLIIMNHPFLDGNKRTGHAAMEVFLILNGLEINASVDEQEQVILAVASGELNREAFTQWLQAHIKTISQT
ncbi:type II toxin-antitoxin system death-on-curing family toxin [Okeania sp. SIO1I7]|uniref:type II toxin-antitoxin system death-on-curing family toxin n=1 Tax=Okeania sp. SIO1I7 TaxID=2607772 RepID=UPI0013FCD63E|nr:type II toxin-antitoxin system death-on-curing family toxin [Okeania sp. SIO1I7]NET29702.1 type II toxin-antitoxin system death-on-curing family toxin [Okeania sp. SIO1I7]